MDDFYLTSAGLATTETTLFVYNKELYRNLSSDFAVYEPIRVMVANRLAQFASQWGKMFEKYNSGTYNNQWMIVDYKKINETKGMYNTCSNVEGILATHFEVMRSSPSYTSRNISQVRSTEVKLPEVSGSDQEIAIVKSM